MRRTVLAVTLLASFALLPITPARADDGCGDNGGDGGSCGRGENTHPAPLPPAGVPALLTLAAGAVMISMRRRVA